MATKNTIASASVKTLGRPKGRKDSYARTRAAADTVYRIARTDENGNTVFMKRGLRRETNNSFDAASFGYESVAVRVLNRLNARAKLSASGTKAAQRNKYTLVAVAAI